MTYTREQLEAAYLDGYEAGFEQCESESDDSIMGYLHRLTPEIRAKAKEDAWLASRTRQIAQGEAE